jgi:hypothetical protein
VIGVAAEAAEAAEAADVEDTVIAPDWEELDVPAALDEDATVSGEVEEEASVEDAIVDVDKYVLGHHVVRLITSGLVPMLMMLIDARASCRSTRSEAAKDVRGQGVAELQVRVR